MGPVSRGIWAAVTPVLDALRPSRKENVVGTIRPTGNAHTAVSKNQVYNPESFEEWEKVALFWASKMLGGQDGDKLLNSKEKYVKGKKSLFYQIIPLDINIQIKNREKQKVILHFD